MAEDLIPTVEGMRMLGLFSKNRPEWVIAEHGLFRHAGTTVPVYDTLGPDVLSYIVKQTGLKTILCSAETTQKVLDSVPQCPSLKAVIQMEQPTSAQRTAADAANIKLYSFTEIVAIGEGTPCSPTPPKPGDVATFCYTSGTTGMPKGVLLTHLNIVSSLAGSTVRGLTCLSNDIHLSYLPLSHVFERMVQAALVTGTGAVGFYQGDTLKITADLAALRPTIFPSVPRLLNRVYDKIIAGATASPVKKFLFETALATKTANLYNHGKLTHPLWDTIVFSKVKKKVGLDRCRVIITGSAPISAHVMDFLRVAFGVYVIEGYGQSENACAGTLTAFEDFTSGHVGGPWPSTEIKLVDVPDMGYLSTDTSHEVSEGHVIDCLGRGEICFRGPSVFKGYFKDPVKTAETIDAEKWCHTGDIGIWLTTGQLKIVDRKKNMFKLSQGEYVAAEKIENVYNACDLVAQSFVYGDSLKSCLVAIVVPDFEVRWDEMGWFGSIGTSHKELCESKEVRELFLKEMREKGKEAKLKGFEQTKAVHLSPELFSVDNDLLTPTFKLKRHQAKLKFKKEIDTLYIGFN
ncbi:unnamed protein product [Chrysoparadoxa australica]